jgi:hypothetical protein
MLSPYREKRPPEHLRRDPLQRTVKHGAHRRRPGCTPQQALRCVGRHAHPGAHARWGIKRPQHRRRDRPVRDGSTLRLHKRPGTSSHRCLSSARPP